MRRSFGFWAFMVILLAGVALAGVVRKPVDRAPMKNLPIFGGAHDSQVNRAYAPSRPLPFSSSLDSTGAAYVAGDTYWDAQHNGSVGKMIGVDSLGYVHMVWTKGEDQNDQNRNVYYNCWDPATTSFITMSGSITGVAVNSSPRAGYTTLAVTPGGWAYPAYHERLNGETTIHASAGMDFQRRFGAFITSQPGRCQEAGAPIEIVWPKVAVSTAGTIHMVSTESPASPDPGHWQRIYYSRGTPFMIGDQGIGIEWDDLTCGGFELIDTAMVIAPIIAASRNTTRIAIVWSHSRDNLNDTNATQYNNDLYYKISEDDGQNWGANINLTHFITALDTFPQMWVDSLQTFVNDTATANKDTNRVYTDCDALFDNNDNLHVAFTTQNYWTWEGTISRWFSEIWHWSEGPHADEFSHVAGMRFKPVQDSLIEVCWPINMAGGHSIGAWQRMTQRPSLALDDMTGYLYCAYQWYDPLQRSDADEGWPMSDILVAVSRNCGRSWSDSTNVTTSGMPIDSGFCNPAPAGEALSERDPSVADRITYEDGVGYLQMAYEIDRDCGTSIQDPAEGVVTLSPMVYRRIPINDISPLPIHDPGHVPFHCDSTGFPGRINTLDPEGIEVCGGGAVDPNAPTLRPQSFHLYQNYPNPFNPVTNIQFDLTRNALVTLKVFNVMGQEVATLFNNKLLSAGAQNIAFDGANLASGVYVYRIEADGHSQSLKMVLMK